VEADAEAYSTIMAVKAVTKCIQLEAQAQAQATWLVAEAEGEVICVKACADVEVVNLFPQEMSHHRQEISHVAVFGGQGCLHTD
jgi:hypothetical protein